MPVPGQPLRRLGFLTIGLFDPADPAAGHRATLEVIELGEHLGFDSAWLRHRHLQYGISSPIAMMAAAGQRTRRIELGTAVTPLGWENPLRLAEDLATVDLLSGGRINPGVSVGVPMQYEHLKAALYPDTAEVEDFTYTRVERLLAFVEGRTASTFAGRQGFEEFSDRVQPYSPGLRARMWYGAGSLRSAQWAGEHVMNLLSSSVVFAEPGGPPTSPRSSVSRSRPSGRPTRPAPPLGSPRAWSSSRPIRRPLSSGPSTRRTCRRGRPGRPARRAPAGCCSPGI